MRCSFLPSGSSYESTCRTDVGRPRSLPANHGSSSSSDSGCAPPSTTQHSTNLGMCSKTHNFDLNKSHTVAFYQPDWPQDDAAQAIHNNASPSASLEHLDASNSFHSEPRRASVIITSITVTTTTSDHVQEKRMASPCCLVVCTFTLPIHLSRNATHISTRRPRKFSPRRTTIVKTKWDFVWHHEHPPSRSSPRHHLRKRYRRQDTRFWAPS